MEHGVLVLAVTLMIAIGPQQAQGPSGTVLVANMDDDSVWLIDLPSGTLPTRIAPHEAATSNDGTMAAVTNYGDERGPGNLIQLIDVEAGSLTGELVVEGYERIHGVRFLPGDSLLALGRSWI
jgi:DNA-binding beta-propeller fold protein YncE